MEQILLDATSYDYPVVKWLMENIGEEELLTKDWYSLDMLIEIAEEAINENKIIKKDVLARLI